MMMLQKIDLEVSTLCKIMENDTPDHFLYRKNPFGNLGTFGRNPDFGLGGSGGGAFLM